MENRFSPSLFAHYRFAEDVDQQPRPWLWPNRIPLGELTLLVGDPGLGKSLLAADLAARVSTGRPWPDLPVTPLPAREGSGEGRAPSLPRSLDPSPPHPFPFPGGTLFASPEDSPARTLVPRLAAAGTDLHYVSILDGVSQDPPAWLRTAFNPTLPPSARLVKPVAPRPLPLTLPAHADELEQAIRAFDHPRLVVLDPLHALLSPAAQTSPAAALAALADIAHRKDVAILAIAHLVKARSTRILYRVRGSLSFTAAARTVLLLSPDPDRPDYRILSTLKSVYGPPPPPLAFRITTAPVKNTDPRSSPPSCEASVLKSPVAFSEFSSLKSPSTSPEFARLNSALPSASALPSEISNPKSATAPSDISSLKPAISPAPRLEWNCGPNLGPVRLPPDLLESSPDTYSALADACAWLTDYLAAGPRPAIDILRDARAAGLPLITLRRAKRLLGLRSIKPAPGAAWLWSPIQPSDK